MKTYPLPHEAGKKKKRKMEKKKQNLSNSKCTCQLRRMMKYFILTPHE